MSVFSFCYVQAQSNEWKFVKGTYRNCSSICHCVYFHPCERIIIPYFIFLPRSNNGNRIVQTRLMHDLLMAIKVSMMLVQKWQENIQGSLWKNHESLVWQSMCNLLKSSTNFLMDGKFSTIQRQVFSLYQSCSFCNKNNLCMEILVSCVAWMEVKLSRLMGVGRSSRTSCELWPVAHNIFLCELMQLDVLVHCSKSGLLLIQTCGFFILEISINVSRLCHSPFILPGSSIFSVCWTVLIASYCTHVRIC